MPSSNTIPGGEKLFIHKFGPIQDVELKEIKQFNVFIGESGSGKSTIMKVLAMMRWIFKMICIRSYLYHSGIERSPFRLKLENILNKNGLNVFLNKESEIQYYNGDFAIIIADGKIRFPRKIVPKELLTTQKISYISDKRVIIPDLAAGNVTLRHNMFYLDDTFLNFQKAIEAIPQTDMDYLGVKMTVKKTSNAGKRVFVGSLSKENGFENLPVTKASSGIQSSVALHFIMEYFSTKFNNVDALNSTVVNYLATTDNLSKFTPTSNIGSFNHNRISVLLEEPELNLFPKNQWGLMKYLVQSCLMSATSLDLTIATHSPYILTALNVMTLAFRAFMKNSMPQQIYDIYEGIPPLDPAKLAAWEVREGSLYPLIDEELQLIDGTYLDSTSDLYENLIMHLNGIIYG